jgi:hypothetical protein
MKISIASSDISSYLQHTWIGLMMNTGAIIAGGV